MSGGSCLVLERSNGGEGLRVNAGKTKIMICGMQSSCRVQASFHVPFVTLEWAATASSAMAASTGCTRNAMGSCLTKDPDYRCTLR